MADFGSSTNFITSLQAKPGTRIQGMWPIGENPAGGLDAIPAFVVQGAQPGPTLWVQATVHGDEFSASWAVSTLGRLVDPTVLRGRLIVFPVLHLHAFLARQKGSSVDGMDISHEYGRNARGSFTQQIAARISEVLLKEADAMIDVHSGTSSNMCIEFASFVTGLRASDKAQAMALATGSPVVVRNDVPTGERLYYAFIYATDHGVPGIFISVGGLRRVEPQFCDPMIDHCRNVMRHLGMLDGTPPRLDPAEILDAVEFLRPSRAGFIISAVTHGEWVTKGQLCATMCDVYGEVIEELRCSMVKAKVIEIGTGVLYPGEIAVELFGAPKRG